LATVITNLLSAIPVFGQDIVELIDFTQASLREGYITKLNAAIVTVLPTIGTVNKHALKKGKKIRLDTFAFGYAPLLLTTHLCL
jgi:hypothetical protein